MSVCILSEARVNPRLLSLVKDHLSISQIPFKIALYEDGEDSIHKTLQQSSAVFCAPGRWLSESIISSNSHIVLYQLWSSGYDKFNHKACCKHKIKFNNNRGNNSVSVSEHAILLMLAANRKLIEMDDRVRTGKWAGNCQGAEMFTLFGKTVAIIGAGNIGSKVAKLCRAFGMKVKLVDPAVNQSLIDIGCTYTDLDDALRDADITTLHLHLNASTAGIIDKAKISLMKENSMLINVSRYQLIADDCEDILLSKNIRLGFDVYKSEPTNGHESILDSANSVFTPHTAGSTLNAIENSISYCVDNIKRALTGNQFDYIK